MYMDLVEAVLAGERLALARLLTRVESDVPEGRTALDRLFPYTGKAHLVGVTGAPGTGKSSLVNQLALAFRRMSGNGVETPRVAVIAVDPSSPFTGGAILGDRVRMRDLAGDPGVFIRSMASRGALGGLARTTAAITQVLDAAGFDLILIETVGAGQAEVDIARLAHTTIVVDVPGLGDDIQAIKAGILEIADILVVNKADLPGAENTVRALRMMLEMARPEQMALVNSNMDRTNIETWHTVVHETVATRGQGVLELANSIIAHREHLRRSGEFQHRERARLKNELDDLLKSALVAHWRHQLPPGKFEIVFERLCTRSISPYAAVLELLE
jgi:LAO/AO transport system kinase